MTDEQFLDDQRPVILFVAPYFAPACHGGVVQIYLGLLKGLTKYRVVVLADRYGASQQECEKWDREARECFGFTVERIDRYEFHVRDSSSSAWLRPFTHLLDLYRFLIDGRKQWAQILKHYKPDLVLCGGTYSAGWLVHDLARDIPLVNYIHGEELTMQVKPRFLQPIMRRWQRASITRANMNLAVSNYTLDKLKTLMAMDNTKLSIMPNFVDLKRFCISGRRNGFRKNVGWTDKLILLTIARLEKRKGVDQVLRALASLKANDALPSDWLYVVGGKGPEGDNLLNQAIQLGIKDHVIFLGFVEDDELPVLYESADIFLQPNREVNGDTEGFGIVFLEASACGTSVIGGKAGGTGDAIAEGISGFRVDGDCVEEIASAINSLSSDPSLRKTMGKQGICWAKQFEVGPTRDKLIAILDRLLQTRNRTEHSY